MNKKTRRLAIVAGVTGDLGRAYFDALSSLPRTRCIGIARGKTELHPVWDIDLLDTDQLTSTIRSLSGEFKDLEEVVLIHGVGKFKFEENGLPETDLDGDGIDDQVYQSNYQTFLNVTRPLVSSVESNEIDLVLCGFGSVSDRFKVPYWRSFSASKDMLRNFIKGLSTQSDHNYGIFINTSTIKTRNEVELRPGSDRSFWLDPREVVLRSISYILNKDEKYKELDIFGFKPYDHPHQYTDSKRVLNRWKAARRQF